MGARKYLIVLAVSHIILCFETISLDSRTATLWKLNSDQTKVIEGHTYTKSSNNVTRKTHLKVEKSVGRGALSPSKLEEDQIFSIIASTVHLGQAWIKEQMPGDFCHDCHKELKKVENHVMDQKFEDVNEEDEMSDLSCGKPVNFTYYDSLVGVLNRNIHPKVPEPQAAIIFSKKSKHLDLNALEKKLIKAKKEKPKSVHLYNQIGNYWRIKGETEKAIECLRSALSVAPRNSEVLLNLARILFTLQYLDDAIYLTRRSLEVQQSDKAPWQQYFTLGEILKAYGHYQEAIVHLRHVLELNPGFEPALRALKEMEEMPDNSIHVYTLVIIVCLVLGVLMVILSSVDGVRGAEYEPKNQRPSNRTMAVRSLRGLGISQRRSKK